MPTKCVPNIWNYWGRVLDEKKSLGNAKVVIAIFKRKLRLIRGWVNLHFIQATYL